MRIAIDLRLLFAHHNLRTRGTVRYTLQLVRETLRVDAETAYLLVTPEDAAPNVLLPEVQHAPNVEIAPCRAGFVPDYECNSPAAVARQTDTLEAWLAGQRVDIFHATIPLIFHRGMYLLPRPSALRVVATLYDLIPLRFPAHYFPADWQRHAYQTALERTLASNRLITISRATQHDAIELFGYPGDQADVIYPAVDPAFRALTDDERELALAGLRRRIRLPEHFVLSVTHFHYVKNLETLLAAYARLPRPLRTAHPLVITCRVSDHDEAILNILLQTLGIVDNVVLTGSIDDTELVGLYNAASLVVYPSRHEGFGYPVAEAMACGAAVITTNASSLPEVAGEAALLVDPDDIGGLAQAMGRLLGDAELRATLKAKGRAQAARFTPDHMGPQLVESFRRSAESRAPAGVADRVAPVLAAIERLPAEPHGGLDALLGRARFQVELERWSQILREVDSQTLSSRRLGMLGLFWRILLRVRRLGAAWHLQALMYRALAETLRAAEAQTLNLQRQIEEQAARIEALERRLSRPQDDPDN